jgi:predicted ATPase
VIRRVDLRYFKCFENLHLPTAPLTLLSGGNASGKSSVLQSLVLLHQTIREHEWSTRLMLNGASLRLGTVTDVVDKVNGRFSFEVGIRTDDKIYHWTFEGERPEMSMAVVSVTASDRIIDNPPRLRHLLPPEEELSSTSLATQLLKLTYLTAERVGPREVYPLVDRQSAPVVGPTGDYAASILYLGSEKNVMEELTLPGVPATLFHQVSEWMRQFFPKCRIQVQPVPQTNAVTLGLSNSDDTDFHRPINVGFGLTQIFPIIVAALAANSGDVLLIENPEVHLHPAGQALMGKFLAAVARAGVQVIVETHSDHVLNGIRRAIRSGNLLPEETAIHFFTPRSPGISQIISPQVDKSGNLDNWPNGFFDQFDKDANFFAGWGE